MGMRYTVREEKYKKIVNNKWVETSGVFILKCNDDSNPIWLPSKFTEYIHTDLDGLELNSQIKHARSITSFLNYVIEQAESNEDEIFNVIRDEGFYGLNLYHLANFLTYLTTTKKNSYKTWKDKEKELIRFMWFLYKRGITGEEGKIESKVVPAKAHSKDKTKRTLKGSTKGVRVWINPFENDKHKYKVKKPKKGNNRRVLKDLEQDVWEQLIEFAEMHYPRIAFGVAIQMMSGLRQGEVVNITIDDVIPEKDENRIVINVKDNPQLFDRNIQTKNSQVKSNDSSIAVVHNFNGRIFEMYDNHMKLIQQAANAESIKLGAFFINANGLPMSGKSYESYFSRLKKDFIQKLYESSPSLAKRLEIETWGSHIGRHVFTNHLVKNHMIDGVDGSPVIKLLQTARRDRNPQSSIDYIDERAITEGVNKAISLASKIATQKGDEWEGSHE